VCASLDRRIGYGVVTRHDWSSTADGISGSAGNHTTILTLPSFHIWAGRPLTPFLLFHPPHNDQVEITRFLLDSFPQSQSTTQHLNIFTPRYKTMSSRYYQLQADGSYPSSRSSSSHRAHRPQPQTNPNYTQRTSTSSDSSSSSSASSSYYDSSYSQRYTMDSSSQQSLPRVETLRCSRCAKCVETVVATARGGNGELRRVSSDDASASGMVRFGHNLYYCERCARMVGYK
jgi:hypothetical protein